MFSKNALTVTSLILSLSLISCEKDSQMLRPDDGQGTGTITPRSTQTPETGPVIMVPAGGGIVVNKKYVLDKYAHWKMSYDAKGNLVKLQSTADPNLVREYIRASNGSGITIMDYEGFKVKVKTLILLDANGRCKESFVTSYGVANGNPTSSTVRFAYKYNAKNQLEEIKDQDNSKRHDVFQYNPDGNLRQVQHYNTNVTQTTTYYYEYPGQAAIVDKNHLSPLWMPHYNQVDEFLPIYGKFNIHLVWKLEYKEVATNSTLDQVYFKYKMNNDGYIDERENSRNTANQTLKDTYLFGYK